MRIPGTDYPDRGWWVVDPIRAASPAKWEHTAWGVVPMAYTMIPH
jgi:hypothetical protein